jgi:hypothetical protein
MSIGAVLAGVAALVIVVAYVARPFRTATGPASLDRAIEAWVAQVRDKGDSGERSVASREDGQAVAGRTSNIHFCPQCGRHVGPDDRFCSGCGTRLRGGSA